MSFSIYSASVPIFLRSLNNILTWLDKAEAHAEARGFDTGNYLELRLAPDMFPFVKQIRVVSDTSKSSVARLAGIEAPSWADEEASLDELRERIKTTIAFVESVPKAKFEGAESREIVMQAGPDRSFTFTGETYLQGFALPNFFFHASMVYALLRQASVALGKMDFLGAP